MQKRYIFIILIMVAAASALLLINNKPSSPTDSLSTANKDITVPDSLKTLAPSIELAAEAFLNQNTSESSDDRRKRLSPYSSAAGPILAKQPNNLSEEVTASKSEVIEIEEVPTEGTNLTVVVKTQTMLLKNGQPTTVYQKYWLSLTMLSDRTWKAYDMGIFER